MVQNNPAQTFLTEAADLLSQIEEVALEVEPSAPDPETINRLFRAFHTIKGSGAMFGFDDVAAFTHHVETALDLVRENKLTFSPELVELILASKDCIDAMLNGDIAERPAVMENSLRVVTALNALHSGSKSPSPSTIAANVTAKENFATASDSSKHEIWRIRFRPSPAIMVGGTDPITLLTELRGLGDCTIRAELEAVPPLESIQPDHCYVVWNIVLRTDEGVNAIKDVFIFVEDGCEIRIEPVVVDDRAETVPVTVAKTRESAASPAPAPTIKTQARENTVRVPAARLDRLVNFVGELVMNQSRLNQIATRVAAPDLIASVEELERLVAEMRDTVLGIRMMPIGATFGRFNRLVHDLSGELGKEIELVTEGAETELDKTVLDQLGDPLVHLIRNSIDHGIETPDERANAGKPRSGTIRLSAVHTGSNVVITIEDDGHGINKAAVLAKAVEKKLVSPDAKLTETEILNLIFLPGFSTAKQITNVSGRGVGMDVVKKQLDALRGGIQLASTPARGTTISLTLPLTLAIIDGLLVELDGDPFIVPMSAVLENVELTRAERARNNHRNVVPVRGELVPYIRLRETFALRDDGPECEKVVIVRRGAERVGLVVDRVLGSHQTVIQSLGRFCRRVEVLSGATVMGDGRVALILDVGGLVNLVEQRAKESADLF